MTFKKGQSGNLSGRPKIKDEDKPTNKSVRQRELLNLVRKFKPLQTKAIQAAVTILDNKDSSEGGKLKSAALIIQTYKELLKDCFDYRYDMDDTAEIQEENKPVFSLKIIND